MKKMFMLISRIVLSAVLTLSIFTTVQAQENSYSISDYHKAIQSEADKYGIEIQIIEYDESKPITAQTIDHGIEVLKNYASGIEVSVNNDNHEFENVYPSPFAIIPERRTRSTSHVVSSPYGGVNIAVQATADVDVNALRIMQVYSVIAYPSGAFINFSSWDTESITWDDNSPSDGYLSGRVIGQCVFSYADPVTGITTGYASRVGFDYTINFR